ncbi:MAG: SDR family oxidoreductase [Arenimonas sp.]|nr:SDR family oxidoreductase [Arenimonas sp.]
MTTPLQAVYTDLADRVVFITGGATGIGAELVRAFCRQHAKVYFIDVSVKEGIALQQQLQQAGHADVQFEAVNVCDVVALSQSIQQCLQLFGAVDVLINNVANDARHAAEAVDEAYWRTCLAVNLDAAFFASKAAFAHMKSTGGNIINVCSINALLCPDNMVGYVTAKSALLGMTKSLAREWGVHGVRVNAITPGWVVTERQLALWLTPEAEAAWMQHVALKERIYPADVANLALFLASNASRMITGQSLVIDGGRT